MAGTAPPKVSVKKVDDEDNDSAMNDESADVQQKNDGVKTPPVSIKIPAASAVESATKASNRSP